MQLVVKAPQSVDLHRADQSEVAPPEPSRRAFLQLSMASFLMVACRREETDTLQAGKQKHAPRVPSQIQDAIALLESNGLAKVSVNDPTGNWHSPLFVVGYSHFNEKGRDLTYAHQAQDLQLQYQSVVALSDRGFRRVGMEKWPCSRVVPPVEFYVEKYPSDPSQPGIVINAHGVESSSFEPPDAAKWRRMDWRQVRRLLSDPTTFETITRRFEQEQQGLHMGGLIAASCAPGALVTGYEDPQAADLNQRIRDEQIRPHVEVQLRFAEAVKQDPKIHILSKNGIRTGDVLIGSEKFDLEQLQNSLRFACDSGDISHPYHRKRESFAAQQDLDVMLIGLSHLPVMKQADYGRCLLIVETPHIEEYYQLVEKQRRSLEMVLSALKAEE